LFGYLKFARPLVIYPAQHEPDIVVAHFAETVDNPTGAILQLMQIFRRQRVEERTRCIFGLPSAGADEVMPLLERCTEVASKFG
jgi:hypothetical protein